jgi:biotin carboxyl carrier protein
MELELKIQNQIHKLQVEFKEGMYHVGLDDKEFLVDSSTVSDYCLSLLVNGKAFTIYLAEMNGKKYLSVAGEKYVIEEAAPDSVTVSGAGSAGIEEEPVAASPMPGKVVKILVNKGDKVEKGQGLVIVEAMKMENEIKSPVSGTVGKINFKSGDLVDAGQPIVEIEPDA